jgi:hypothetical protein
MLREFKVILRNEESSVPKPLGTQVLGFLNDLIKSPLFIFVFGAGLGTAYPLVKEWFTPSDQLILQRTQEQARADAALIAPFIGYLNAEKPGQFETARAALLALDESASAADNGKRRPVYAAVNRAIEAVAIQLRPPTDKSLSVEATRQIEAIAKPAPLETTPTTPSVGLLSKDTLVYIQVDRNDSKSQAIAENTFRALRSASVLVAGIEKLATTTMPKKNQIRYFNDEDKPKAEQLAALVSRTAGGEVLLAEPPLKAKPGTLEVWFGTQAQAGIR